jgi:hypothetical protein
MTLLRLGACLGASVFVLTIGAAAPAAEKSDRKKTEKAEAAEGAAAAVPASAEAPAPIAPGPVFSGSAGNLPLLTNEAAPKTGAAPAPKAETPKAEPKKGLMPDANGAPPAAAANAAAKPVAGGKCAYYEERVTPFTSWEASDRVAVRVVGESCANASVLVSIVDAKGKAIFTHAAIFNQLNPMETTPAGMAKTVEGVWRVVGPRRTSEIAEWAPAKESYVAGEEMPLWDAAQHEAARHADMPLICYPEDGMSGQCVFYDATRASVRELIRLLGPTTFQPKSRPGAGPAKASAAKAAGGKSNQTTDKSKGKDD